jgi:2-phosphosulfolactate phosphatase
VKIKILGMVEGAQEATGLAVIIDVFRAFSLECYAFAAGAGKIIPVADIEAAYALKKAYPESLLVGERQEQKPEGFDFGNSPAQLIVHDLAGKTIIHTTSSGTQGLANALNADEVITGSFVNADAILQYIRVRKPDTVSLVAMGYACLYPVEEDDGCATYLANELNGLPNDFAAMVKEIRETSGARFFLPEKQHFAPEEDFHLCLNINRFNFVLRKESENGHMVIRKVEPRDFGNK